MVERFGRYTINNIISMIRKLEDDVEKTEVATMEDIARFYKQVDKIERYLTIWLELQLFGETRAREREWR